MRDLSCFEESSVQIAGVTSLLSVAGGGGKGAAQNRVRCLYQAQLSGRPYVIPVMWSKGLSITVDDMSAQCLCKADVKPLLFSKKKGPKSLDAGSVL